MSIKGLLFLIVISFSGYFFPEIFISLKNLIVPLLAVIMMSMGLTLTGEDFLRILKRPFIIFYGAFLQFSIMPVLGYILSVLFSLSAEYTVGMVLVGSAPGGTASNLITFLSKGNLPYSISMTTLSTLLSPLLTPLWTLILAGKIVHVPFFSMAITTLKIIVFPVLLGMLLRKLLKEKVKVIEPFLPGVAIFSISLIIAVIFALNRDEIKTMSLLLIFAVTLHSVLGFVLGFLFGRVMGLNNELSKTLSIEVGMQNSGLSTVLAIKFFSPASALPSALFSIIQNIIGLLISPIFAKLKN